MATVTVTTTSYVSGPDNDDTFDPEAIVRDALSSADAIYLVEVKGDRVLFERSADRADRVTHT